MKAIRLGRIGWTIAAVAAAAIVTPPALRKAQDLSAAHEAAREADVLSENIEFFEARLRDDPRNYIIGGRLTNSYLLRFQAQAELADIERAEALARRLLPIVLDTVAAHARLAFVLLTQHKFSEALEAAEFAASVDSTDEAALAALFDAAFASGRYALARNTLERLEPRSLTHQLREARWYSAEGQLAAAFHSLSRGCRKLQSSPVSRQTVAWCFTELADIAHQRWGVEEAKIWLDRALELQPDYRGAIEGLADIAYGRGHWKEARRLYSRIESGAHPDLYMRLAEVSEELGKVAEARSYEARFLRLANDPAKEPLFAHALVEYYAGPGADFERALEIMMRDLERRKSIESYELLSWVYLQSSRLIESLEACDRAAKLGGASATGLYIRARILDALGDTYQAHSLFESALSYPTLLAPYVQRELHFDD